MNSACTFGSWHPLAAEKLMALDMNMADDMSVFQFGILRIRRPDKLLCGFNFFGYWGRRENDKKQEKEKKEKKDEGTINVHLIKRFSLTQHSQTHTHIFQVLNLQFVVLFAINKLVFTPIYMRAVGVAQAEVPQWRVGAGIAHATRDNEVC